MLKKLLVATAAMAISATTFAGISLSGLYEGTLDSHGAYTQDIHTTMKGTSGNSSVQSHLVLIRSQVVTQQLMLLLLLVVLQCL